VSDLTPHAAHDGSRKRRRGPPFPQGEGCHSCTTLAIAVCQTGIADRLLRTAYWLLPTAYCFLHAADYSLRISAAAS
jgi:hypothetical protein